MKRFKLIYLLRMHLIVFTICVLVSSMTVPSAFAFIEEMKDFSNKALDAIENGVKATGLPDLKWKIIEKYKLTIKPYIKTHYDLTSNALKSQDSKNSDNIYSITPGFQWLYKTDKAVLGGAYEATFKYYAKYANQNTQDQDFLVYANLFPTDDIYVRISEKLTQEGAVSNNPLFKPVDYLDNTVNIVVGYRANEKWTYEVGYENYDRDFQNVIAKRYSYNENKYDLRAYYQINPQHRAFSGLRLGDVAFEDFSTRDTFYFEIPVGIEGTLPWNIKYSAMVGLHHRNLEASDRNDITNVVTNLSLSRTFNHKRTNIQGGFLRRPVESAFSSATTYDEKLWYAALKHLFTPKLRGRLNAYVGNRDFEERVFTGSRLIIGGAVFVVPPSQVKRDDDIFGINMGFDYNVRKWMVLHLDYQYSRRDSNISVLDYTENALSLGATIPL
ncbi:MAG: outer membrane beta-barrel protein [Candidatus Omnitrophica bacterium]|nr:outer membrane beta-barrel protein [Candidatus Omnitrophota bacterium]